MNKPYWGLWALLLAALLFFAALSFWQDGISVGPLDIKTTTFAQNVRELFSVSDQSPVDTMTQVQDWRAPMDTTAKNILFIGDSMLEGLAPRLAAYCDKNGHTLVEVIWYSSSTLCWGQTARLTELINKFHPNYIFVCLGANELYVPDIKKARRPYLKKMLAEIGDIPYVWIGPPNWDEDTGINDMLAKELGRGCFYLSAKDQFDRSRDGAHPTRASAHRWMDRVIKWMDANCAHPIRLDAPAVETSRASRIVVYQPPV